MGVSQRFLFAACGLLVAASVAGRAAEITRGGGQPILDVVVTNANAADQICRGAGDGTFECVDFGGPPGNSSLVLHGLIDGDARPDVVISTSASLMFCPGDGAGGFGRCVAIDTAGRRPRGAALGFLDGDAHLDLVLANGATGAPLERRNQACLGNGDGTFDPCVDVSVDTGRSNEVALGFVNADAHLDAVFANTTVGGGDPESPRNRVCFGNGDGTFASCSDVDTTLERTGGVAVGMLDDDGHLDLVFAESTNQAGGESNHVCLGNGNGTFTTCTDIPLATGTPRDSFDVVLGLVNGDEHLDAVFANGNMRRNRVCLGNGDGTFAPCTNVSTDENYTSVVRLGLMDDDGHLDAVFANAVGGRNRICLGAGDGSFSSCADVSEDEHNSGGVALIDLGESSIFADGFESGDTSAWAVTVP